MTFLRKPSGFLACILLGILAGCGRGAPDAPAVPETVTFASADGAQLVATLYPVPAAHPSGLVFIPMLGANRHTWDAFALRAQRAGYLGLAVDLRGHGDSKPPDGHHPTYRSFDTNDWLATLEDIDAAVKCLIERGADPKNVALVGASIGANLALRYAVDHPNVPAVVLLSPGLDYRGITTEKEIVDYGKRPVLLLTSRDDSYAASSCATLKSVAIGFCEIREYDGAAHGTDLLAVAQNAPNQILVWLKPIIGPEPATP